MMPSFGRLAPLKAIRIVLSLRYPNRNPLSLRKSKVSDVLKISDYTLCSEERGAVPITDDPLVRTLGQRVMAIGARAGRIKPSTGYAFMRVQKDSEEIVESLLLQGHPFDVPDDPDLYDVLDAVMLKVMDTRGDYIQNAFTAMFKRNPINHILRFLDEEASPWQNLMLVATMPPQVFLHVFLKVSFRENLFEIMGSFGFCVVNVCPMLQLGSHDSLVQYVVEQTR